MTRELLISRDCIGTRTLLLDDGCIVGFDFDDGQADDGDAALVGSVWRGRVADVAPGMHAAFVDLGIPGAPPAFLSAGELVAGAAHVPGRPDIAGVVSRGRMVPVQVVREAAGKKGPRVSMSPSLSGTYCVLAPFDSSLSGVSRSAAAASRGKLRDLVPKLEEAVAACMAELLADTGLVPASGLHPGVVLRTSAVGASAAAIEADALSLARRWARTWRRAAQDGKPALIEPADDLVQRTLRGAGLGPDDAVLTDDRELLPVLRDLVGDLPEPARPTLALEDDAPGGLFAAHGCSDPEERLLARTVALDDGATLVIERTEALTVIDVNAGHGAGGARRDKGSDALKVNLASADEIARQLVARGITGAVVIDFVTLRSRQDAKAVCAQLRDGFKRLGAQAAVSEMSGSGLVEVTRKGAGASLLQRLTQSCRCCGEANGELTDTALLALFERKAVRELSPAACSEGIRVLVGQRLADLLAKPDCQSGARISARLGCPVGFAAADGNRLPHVADSLLADTAFALESARS